MITREQVRLESKTITFSFPYPPPFEKDYLKSMFGARWNPTEKIWTCRRSQALLDWLVDQGLLDSDQAVSPSLPSVGEDASQPDHFNVLLRPYQRAGASFLEKMPAAIMGDEMGLGKTLQSLAAVRNSLPALIICPLIAKSVWAREIEKALPHRTATVLDSKVSKFTRDKLDADFLIINYDNLGKWSDTFAMMQFGALICDEAHYLKTPKAKRTKEVQAIASRTPKRLMVTGTPVLNRPIELYSLLRLLDLEAEVEPGGFWRFVEKYCGGYINRFSGNYETKGSSNLQQLHNLVSPFMLRRLKKDVLKELPDKQLSKMEWELPAKDLSEYRFASTDFQAWYASIHPEMSQEEIMRKPLGLMQLGALRRLSTEAKVPGIVDLLENSFVPEGKKAIIFSDYRASLASLYGTFRDQSVIIWGGQSSAEREAAEIRFQNDPDCLFCFGQTRAAGVAVTLTAADTAIFLTVPWTPGEFGQASDRIHRIGQTRSVNIIVPIVTEIDAALYDVVAMKDQMVNELIDGDADSALAKTEVQGMAQIAARLGIQIGRQENEEEELALVDK